MKRPLQLALLVSCLAAAPAAAQVRVFAGPSGSGSSALLLAERALRMRDDLKLSADQVSQLESIRKDELVREQEFSSRVIQLQSDLRAGKLESRAVRDSLEARDDVVRHASRAARDRARKLLSQDQLDILDDASFSSAGSYMMPGRVLPPGEIIRGRSPGRRYLDELQLQPGRRYFRFDDLDPDAMRNFKFDLPDFDFDALKRNFSHDFDFDFPHDFKFDLPEFNFDFRMPDFDFKFDFPKLDWQFRNDMKGFSREHRRGVM